MLLHAFVIRAMPSLYVPQRYLSGNYIGCRVFTHILPVENQLGAELAACYAMGEVSLALRILKQELWEQ